MTPLDALPGEDAIAYATRQLAWYRENPVSLLGVPVRYMVAEDGEMLAADQVARSIGYGRIDANAAVARVGDGDPLFYSAFTVLAAADLAGEIRLAEPLRGHVIAALRRKPRLRRQNRIETNYFRNIVLAMLVHELRQRFGLSATGRSAKRLSACGVVGRASGLGYEAVVKATAQYLKCI